MLYQLLSEANVSRNCDHHKVCICILRTCLYGRYVPVAWSPWKIGVVQQGCERNLDMTWLWLYCCMLATSKSSNYFDCCKCNSMTDLFCWYCYMYNRLKGSLQAARLDLYVNGEILCPSDDKRLISQVPLRDRMVSIGGFLIPSSGWLLTSHDVFVTDSSGQVMSKYRTWSSQGKIWIIQRRIINKMKSSKLVKSKIKL